MYLAYVDESGDSGLINSPTHYYVLSTLVVHETDWQNTFSQIKDFRKNLRTEFGVRLRDELRADDLVRGQGFSYRLKLDRDKRMDIYKRTILFLSGLRTVKTFSVCIRKDSLYRRDFDVLGFAWKVLITRLHYVLAGMTLSNKREEKGIIISDRNDDARIRSIFRQLRVWNPVRKSATEYTNVPVSTLIEDPFVRESQHSHFVQLCDIIVFSVAGQEFLIKSLVPYGFSNFYSFLKPIALPEVSKANELGIVYFPRK